MDIFEVFLWLTYFLSLFHNTSNAPVADRCPFPALPNACEGLQESYKLWCPLADSVVSKICEVTDLSAIVTKQKLSYPLVKDVRPLNKSQVTQFCDNTTLLHQLAELTSVSMERDKCINSCNDNVACALTLINLQFYFDVLLPRGNESQSQVLINNTLVAESSLKSNQKLEIEGKVGQNSTSSMSNTPDMAAVVDQKEIPVADDLKPDDVQSAIGNKTEPGVQVLSELVKNASKSNNVAKTQQNSTELTISSTSTVSQVVSNEQKDTNQSSSVALLTEQSTKGQFLDSEVTPLPAEERNDKGNKVHDELDISSSPVATMNKISPSQEVSVDEGMGAMPPPPNPNEPKEQAGEISSSPRIEPIPSLDSAQGNGEGEGNEDADFPPDDPGIEEDVNDTILDKEKIKGIEPEQSLKEKEGQGLVDVESDTELKLNHDHRYANPPDHGDPYMTSDVTENSGYFQYFLTLLAFTFFGFILFHNKKRLIALVVEGRRPNGGGRRGSRRRNSSSTYRKLENNFD